MASDFEPLERRLIDELYKRNPDRQGTPEEFYEALGDTKPEARAKILRKLSSKVALDDAQQVLLDRRVSLLKGRPDAPRKLIASYWQHIGKDILEPSGVSQKDFFKEHLLKPDSKERRDEWDGMASLVSDQIGEAPQYEAWKEGQPGAMDLAWDKTKSTALDIASGAVTFRSILQDLEGMPKHAEKSRKLSDKLGEDTAKHWGLDPRHTATYKEAEKAAKKGNLMPFAEFTHMQGAQSLPHMFFFIAQGAAKKVAAPAWIASQAGDIAKRRSENKDVQGHPGVKDETKNPGGDDLAVGLAAATLVWSLNNISAQLMFPFLKGVKSTPPAKRMSKAFLGKLVAVAKSAGKGAAVGAASEGFTESAQGAVEYLAEHFGTDAGISGAELWQVVKESFWAGVGIGGTIGAFGHPASDSLAGEYKEATGEDLIPRPEPTDGAPPSDVPPADPQTPEGVPPSDVPPVTPPAEEVPADGSQSVNELVVQEEVNQGDRRIIPLEDVGAFADEGDGKIDAVFGEDLKRGQVTSVEGTKVTIDWMDEDGKPTGEAPFTIDTTKPPAGLTALVSPIVSDAERDIDAEQSESERHIARLKENALDKQSLKELERLKKSKWYKSLDDEGRNTFDDTVREHTARFDEETEKAKQAAAKGTEKPATKDGERPDPKDLNEGDETFVYDLDGNKIKVKVTAVKPDGSVVRVAFEGGAEGVVDTTDAGDLNRSGIHWHNPADTFGETILGTKSETDTTPVRVKDAPDQFLKDKIAQWKKALSGQDPNDAFGQSNIVSLKFKITQAQRELDKRAAEKAESDKPVDDARKIFEGDKEATEAFESAYKEHGDLNKAKQAAQKVAGTKVQRDKEKELAQAQEDLPELEGRPRNTPSDKQDTVTIKNVGLPNNKADVKYMVVELADLHASHDTQGKPNPKYPASLQPRDRSKKSYIKQVHDQGRDIDPDVLGDKFPTATDGAMLVDRHGVLISGTGRALSLRVMYDLGKQIGLYQESVLGGFNTKDMKEPVLVRMLTGNFTAEQLRAMAEGGNKDDRAKMDAAEQAASDAEWVGEIMPLIADGKLTNQANRKFVEAFIRRAGEDTRGEILDDEGSVTAAGLARMNSAVLLKAYTGVDPNSDVEKAFVSTIKKLINSAEIDAKTALNALVALGSSWAVMRGNIAVDGSVDAKFDITAAIQEAMGAIQTVTADPSQNMISFMASQKIGEGSKELRDAVLGAFYRSKVQSPRTLPGKAFRAESSIVRIFQDYAKQATKVGSITTDSLLDLAEKTPDATNPVDILFRAVLNQDGKMDASLPLSMRTVREVKTLREIGNELRGGRGVRRGEKYYYLMNEKEGGNLFWVVADKDGRIISAKDMGSPDKWMSEFSKLVQGVYKEEVGVEVEGKPEEKPKEKDDPVIIPDPAELEWIYGTPQVTVRVVGGDWYSLDGFGHYSKNGNDQMIAMVPESIRTALKAKRVEAWKGEKVDLWKGEKKPEKKPKEKGKPDASKPAPAVKDITKGKESLLERARAIKEKEVKPLNLKESRTLDDHMLAIDKDVRILTDEEVEEVLTHMTNRYEELEKAKQEGEAEGEIIRYTIERVINEFEMRSPKGQAERRGFKVESGADGLDITIRADEEGKRKWIEGRGFKVEYGWQFEMVRSNYDKNDRLVSYTYHVSKENAPPVDAVLNAIINHYTDPNIAIREKYFREQEAIDEEFGADDSKEGLGATNEDVDSFVSEKTKALIRVGIERGMDPLSIEEQIIDIASATEALMTGRPMFLIGSQMGAGKTFVMAGALREMLTRNPDFRAVFLVTSRAMIAQTKPEIAPILGDLMSRVTIRTYNSMLPRSANRLSPASLDDKTILVMDEADKAKNVKFSKSGQVVPTKITGSANEAMRRARFTLMATGSPFANPAEMRYLAATGVFNPEGVATNDMSVNMGHFEEWAADYGVRPGDGSLYEPSLVFDGTVRDGIAARKWMVEQGIYTYRQLRIPEGKKMEISFWPVRAKDSVVSLHHRIAAAGERAAAEVPPKQRGLVMSGVTRSQKRISETNKAEEAAEAVVKIAEAHPDHQIIVFEETKYRVDLEKTGAGKTVAQMLAANKATPEGRKKPHSAASIAFLRQKGEFGVKGYLASVGQAIEKAVKRNPSIDDNTVAYFTGDESDAQLQANKAAWDRGEKRILVSTIGKGGRGLSFHDQGVEGKIRPRVMVVVNLPWTASEFAQVMFRTTRGTMKSNSLVYMLYAENLPIDLKVKNRVQGRAEMMGAMGSVDTSNFLKTKEARAFMESLKALAAGPVMSHKDFEQTVVEMNDIAARINPGVKVEAINAPTIAPGRRARGTFTPDEARGIIRAAMSGDPIATFGHELLHSLRHLFSSKEWNALIKAAVKGNWIDKHRVRARYPEMFLPDGTPKPQAYEEAVADEVGARLAHDAKPKDKVHGLIERIREFFLRLLAYLRDIGRQNLRAEIIFSKIKSGEIGRRPGSPTGQETKNSIGGGRAIGSPSGTLGEAAIMFRRGDSKDAIWRKTGWMVGVDKLWRFEFDDADVFGGITDRASAKKTLTALFGGEAKLGDILGKDAPLFQHYPELREIPVSAKITSIARPRRGKHSIDVSGSIVVNRKTKQSSMEITFPMSSLTPIGSHYDVIRLPVSQKVDYLLGRIETATDAARVGLVDGSPAAIYDPIPEVKNDSSRPTGGKASTQPTDGQADADKGRLSGTPISIFGRKLAELIAHETQHLIQNLEGFAEGGDWTQLGVDHYWHLAGEAEARDVEHRLGKSRGWREANPPNWDGIPESKLLGPVLAYSPVQSSPRPPPPSWDAKHPERDERLQGLDKMALGADGKPKVFYRGMNKDPEGGDMRPDSYYTTSKKLASTFGRVSNVYLAMKNPIDIDSKEYVEISKKYRSVMKSGRIEDYWRHIESLGYDAIVSGGFYQQGMMEIQVVFNPENVINAKTGETMAPPDTSYQGGHRPMADGPRLHDLLEVPMLPDDVYAHPEWYDVDPKTKEGRETIAAINAMRGKPDAMVTIYRASPGKAINSGDWVSLSKTYAEDHAYSTLLDDSRATVEMKVPAKHVRHAGAGLMEWGYFPDGNLFSRTAYHGSSYKFEGQNYNMDKALDSGANMFGWGTYFTENKALAETYAWEGGHLSQVKLKPKESEYLLNFSYLKEQSPQVQKAIREIFEKLNIEFHQADTQLVKGHGAYASIKLNLDSAEAASNMLLAHGVKGIKKPGIKKGEAIYVMFDPANDVEIKGIVIQQSESSKLGGGFATNKAAEILRKQIDKIHAGAGIRVKLVHGYAGLPKNIRESIPEGSIIDGYADPATKTSYIVTGNIHSPERLRQVFAHEVIGHLGVEGVTSPKEWAKIRTLIDGLMTSKSGEAKRIADRLKEGGYDLTDKSLRDKEFIAHAAEMQATEGLVGKLLRMVRTLVRKFLKSIGINSVFSGADIDSLIRRAAHSVRRGGKPRAGGDMDGKFSIGGEKAQGAPTGTLGRAQEMTEQGFAPGHIWRDTGWIKGVDGKWRFEFDDADVFGGITDRASAKKALLSLLKSKDLRLGKVFGANAEIFKHYPQLRDAPVFTVLMDPGRHVGGMIAVGGAVRTTHSGSEHMFIYPYLAKSSQDYESLIKLSEESKLEHLLDHIENAEYLTKMVLSGTNLVPNTEPIHGKRNANTGQPSSRLPTQAPGQHVKVEPGDRQSGAILPETRLSPKSSSFEAFGKRLREAVIHETQHLIQSVEGFMGGGDSSGADGRDYWNLGGEAEARETSNRIGKTANWRGAHPPNWDGIHESELITEFHQESPLFSRRQNDSEPYQLKNKEAQGRIEKAAELQKEDGATVKVVKQFDEGLRQWARERPNIVQNTHNSDILGQLNKLEAAGDAAKDAVEGYFKRLRNLLRGPGDLYNLNLLLNLRDLEWSYYHPEFAQGKLYGNKFGLDGIDEIVEERIRLDAFIDSTPNLKEALALRTAVALKLKDAMVEHGVLTEEQAANPHYTKHMIIEYTQFFMSDSKRSGATRIGPKGRVGTDKDHVMNLAMVESSWMFKAHRDIAVAKTWNWLKESKYNAATEMVAQAKASNEQRFLSVVLSELVANGIDPQTQGHLAGLRDAGLDEVMRYVKETRKNNPGLARALPGTVMQELFDIKQKQAMAFSQMENVMANLSEEQMSALPKRLSDMLSDEGSGDAVQFARWLVSSPNPLFQREGVTAGLLLGTLSKKRVLISKTVGKDYINPDNGDQVFKAFGDRESQSLLQPDSRNGERQWRWFTGKAISGHVATELMGQFDAIMENDVTDGVIDAKTVAKLRKALLAPDVLIRGGLKEWMIVDKGIASTIVEFGDKGTDMMLDKGAQRAISLWKAWRLYMPHNFLDYITNNFMSDFEGLVQNPHGKGIFLNIKEAYQEVRVSMYQGLDVRIVALAREYGVMHSGLTAQEITANMISELGPDAALIFKDKSKLKSYLTTMRNLALFRENTFRLAAFKYYYDLFVVQGKTLEEVGFGASNPKFVKGISDPAMLAAQMASDAFGNYGNLSSINAFLAKRIFVFWKWRAANTDREVHLFKNIALSPQAMNMSPKQLKAHQAKHVAVGETLKRTRQAIHYGYRFALFVALTHGINWLFFEDEEEKLSEEQRVRPHLMLPPDKEGNLRAWTFQTATSDFIDWFGGEQFVGAMWRLLRNDGSGSWMAAAKAFGKGAINSMINQVSPLIKMPMEAFWGKTTFPDAFNPRTIFDPWKHLIAGTVALEREYSEIMRRLGYPVPQTKGSYPASWWHKVGFVNYDLGQLDHDRTKNIMREVAAETPVNEMTKILSALTVFMRNKDMKMIRLTVKNLVDYIKETEPNRRYKRPSKSRIDKLKADGIWSQRSMAVAGLLGELMTRLDDGRATAVTSNKRAQERRKEFGDGPEKRYQGSVIYWGKLSGEVIDIAYEQLLEAGFIK